MSIIPRGVTVRESGDESIRADRSGGLLWRMSREPDLAVVVETMCAMLGVPKESSLLHLHLDVEEPDAWRRLRPGIRLMKLGCWLASECFELVDTVEGE